ncbi:PPOX class F420-dependent enzyme [Nocardia donostiensis]|uniref:PPOX class F420-dependent oxidoreductase n=1 Tax=Nocardia donostiensis TaxID=1538463 RepID=UPI0009D93628|nr:PPOX class F420-dependent oxidoreductase [Nocardia donostiensis]OQS14905.1 PPOX class F420-dependent enzyme [Nocardia donostiensis]
MTTGPAVFAYNVTEIVFSDALKKILDESLVFATVATVGRDGRPHQTVVWIDRDGDELLYSTTVDRAQAKNIARDPRISVLILAPDNPYSYAEIQGTATLTPDLDLALPDRLARKYTGKSYAEFNPDPSNDGDRVVIRIRPDRITGHL